MTSYMNTQKSKVGCIKAERCAPSCCMVREVCTIVLHGERGLHHRGPMCVSRELNLALGTVTSQSEGVQ